MPGIATHITVVQRLAASSPELRALLGDPTANDDTPEGRRMRFSNLGAAGPDIFYALADYGDELQWFENFVTKVGGTFECIGELIEKIDRFVSGVESELTFGVSDSIKQTFELVHGILKEAIVALVVDAGFNFWPVFQSQRQKDRPRQDWFWADYLHYIRPGQFASTLLSNTKGNPNLRAYALGYLTHYVTDVVGHGYVNQVVQAPYRLYWQRHHLVENFIDAYVWDRYHLSQSSPAPPSTDEQPLDLVVNSPNEIGRGAPLTFGRLHDHIAIGVASLGDPVDRLVQAVCDKIEGGLFDLGVAEQTHSSPPDDADFDAWRAIMVKTLHDTYDTASVTPHNLGGDGFPSADDIAGAYGVVRLFLRLSTEEKIQEPKAPDIASDISSALKKFYDDLKRNLERFPPFPHIGSDFSLDALWDALTGALEWLVDVGEAIGRTVFDAITDILNTAGTILTEPLKFILYFLNKWLFSIYRQLRFTLVLNGYTPPFTSELTIPIGGPLRATGLWLSPGDLPASQYPVEQTLTEEAFIRSQYTPFRAPNTFPRPLVEQPPVLLAGPFRSPVEFSGATPDAFIDGDLGPADMFHAATNGAGPQLHEVVPGPPPLGTFGHESRNFGGVIANCRKAIELAEAGFPPPSLLPDYNLDSDRGWAWPSWDVAPRPTGVGDPPDPLNPAHLRHDEGGQAHVNAAEASD
jgi:hypothetical protein